MKRILYHIILAIVITASVAASAVAQERSVENRLVIDIPFVLSGYNNKGINMKLAGESLQKAARELELLNADLTSTLKSIEFYSSVSPEGSAAANRRVGAKRLKTAEQFVRKYLTIPASVLITYDNRYIPWNQVLLPAIEADVNVPYRSEMLKLFYRSPDAKGRDMRLYNLFHAKGGRIYDIVRERYFPLMRRSGAIITVDRPVYNDMATNGSLLSGSIAPMETSNFVLNDSIPYTPLYSAATVKASESERSPYGLLLKTNAIGWGLAITNIGIEFDFAKHWSISVPVLYSAHNYFTSTIKFRTLATQPEIRYWLKEDNTGFFAGAHFGVGSYNIATNGIKRYQDHNGNTPALGGGISIGYRLPISKNDKWALEFTVGAGGYKLCYDTFYNVKNGRLIETVNKTYWGLDNAAINVSYRFDLKKRKR